MDRNLLNISNIESYLYSIMQGKICDNTFVGTLPSTIREEWEDICLIDCGSAIADLDALGGGVVLIWLYAKPISGNKNVGVLQRMEQSLNNVIEKAFHPHYKINRRNTYTDYDADRDLHCNIIEINIVIV